MVPRRVVLQGISLALPYCLLFSFSAGLGSIVHLSPVLQQDLAVFPEARAVVNTIANGRKRHSDADHTCVLAAQRRKNRRCSELADQGQTDGFIATGSGLEHHLCLTIQRCVSAKSSGVFMFSKSISVEANSCHWPAVTLSK